MNFLRSLKFLARHNGTFLIPYFIILTFGSVLAISLDKGDTVLWLNQKHTDYLSEVMVILSFIGEGGLFGIFLLMLGFFKLKYLFKGLLCYGLANLITIGLKHTFDYVRPLKYFGDSVTLNFVEGVRVHNYLSFPSGHTTSGFSMMMFLALITPNKTLKFIYLIFGTMIGISRVYLVQHFLQDIVLGSLIGVLFTLLVYHYFESHNKISHSNWYNFSLYERLFKK